MSTPSVERLAIRGSAWTASGYVTELLLRLGGNLVVTRLLFPEAFGLMTLVWAVLMGLQLLSDPGIDRSIIWHERGGSQPFLDTAWTLQAARGALLWACAAAIAGPVARFYEAPELGWLLPVAGATVLCTGLNSTRLHQLNRDLALGRLTLIELASQVTTVGVMIVWAWRAPSVWALVGGPLVGHALKTLLSHTATSGPRHRLHFERELARPMLRFGKWILLTSTVTFLAAQSDRLLLGRLVSFEELGVYTVAFFLSSGALMLVARLSQRVLFPAFGRVAREDADALSAAYARTQRRLGALILPLAGGLLAEGGLLVEVLYDDRYAAAGWMLEALALRIVFVNASQPAIACLLALGQPRYGFASELMRALWIWTALPLGWLAFGLTGAVWAVALEGVARLPFLWIGLRRHGLLSLRRELAGLGWVALGFAVARLLSPAGRDALAELGLLGG